MGKRLNHILFLLDGNLTKVVLVLMFISVLILGVMSIAYSGQKDSLNLIIAFFGILATFIVVSNYSQVSEIKTETNRKIHEQNLRIEEKYNLIDKGIEEKLATAGKRIDTIESAVWTESGEPRTLSLQGQFESFMAESDELKKNHDELARLTAYLVNGDHRALLLTILQGKEYRCSVKYAGKTYIVNAFMHNKANVYFDIKGVCQTMSVENVNGVLYDKEEMEQYLKIFNTIDQIGKV